MNARVLPPHDFVLVSRRAIVGIHCNDYFTAPNASGRNALAVAWAFEVTGDGMRVTSLRFAGSEWELVSGSSDGLPLWENELHVLVSRRPIPANVGGLHAQVRNYGGEPQAGQLIVYCVAVR